MIPHQWICHAEGGLFPAKLTANTITRHLEIRTATLTCVYEPQHCISLPDIWSGQVTHD